MNCYEVILQLNACLDNEMLDKKGSLLAPHGKLFILLQKRVWIERFVYTFHTIDRIQWHSVFHNYDFLHSPRTIKAWKM